MSQKQSLTIEHFDLCKADKQNYNWVKICVLAQAGLILKYSTKAKSVSVLCVKYFVSNLLLVVLHKN